MKENDFDIFAVILAADSHHDMLGTVVHDIPTAASQKIHDVSNHCTSHGMKWDMFQVDSVWVPANIVVITAGVLKI